MSKHKHKRKRSFNPLKEELPPVIEEELAHIDEVFEQIEEKVTTTKKVVTTLKINIREDFSLTSKILGSVEEGTLLYVTGESIRDWSPVETVNEPKWKGFAKSKYLEEVIDGVC